MHVYLFGLQNHHVFKKGKFSSDTNDEINVEPKHYQCREGHGSLSNEQYIS